jgi:hypothetical protein
MRDIIAEKLLIRLMNWDPEKISSERSSLEIMAKYKYNAYQGFSPGMRFLESLALWLQQFKTPEERNIAYDFIKERLIFYSNSEMEQLVSMAFPDHIKPILLKKAAIDMGIPEYRVSKLAKSKAFKISLRRSLFLGLSDGARLDIFRRSNRKDLSHEQIYPLYDISEAKAEDLKQELEKDLKTILNETPNNNICNFKNVFLLDDFSGSGKSYLRMKDDKFKGKLFKAFENINLLSQVFDDKIFICNIIYIATEESITYLTHLTKKLFKSDKYDYKLDCIQYLQNDIKVNDKLEFFKLIEEYYDPDIESDATRVGGSGDVKLGFSNCGLPLVMHHNTPNNSIALLWSYDHLKIRGLFHEPLGIRCKHDRAKKSL